MWLTTRFCIVKPCMHVNVTMSIDLLGNSVIETYAESVSQTSIYNLHLKFTNSHLLTFIAQLTPC